MAVDPPRSGAASSDRASVLRRIADRLRRGRSPVRDAAPAPGPSETGAFPDRFVTFEPAVERAFDLFKGEWNSIIPGYGGGFAALFEDSRIRWFERELGGFVGRSVLELGPLEGGHTYMMARAGARVRAIESNVRAFMKCLLVRNAFGFDAEFLLGDFRPYLRDTADRFDFLAMSGVLYHMIDPVQLVVDATRVSDAIGVWTHYYDRERLMKQADFAQRFDFGVREADLNGRRIMLHEQRYAQTLDWAGFSGGTTPDSLWLSRESLFDLFDACGFDIRVGQEAPDHPNGPAITFLATRR